MELKSKEVGFQSGRFGVECPIFIKWDLLCVSTTPTCPSYLGRAHNKFFYPLKKLVKDILNYLLTALIRFFFIKIVDFTPVCLLYFTLLLRIGKFPLVRM